VKTGKKKGKSTTKKRRGRGGAGGRGGSIAIGREGKRFLPCCEWKPGGLRYGDRVEQPDGEGGLLRSPMPDELKTGTL